MNELRMGIVGAGIWGAVSYTHLDVYKRQGLPYKAPEQTGV